ncbi:DMT family transporter [Paenibacillus filicis]|uniref:DMT family transporter n=1 Tax=Paenibacillus filicis TaxID=669464 RepID=A0ABU9DLM2_9BACL
MNKPPSMRSAYTAAILYAAIIGFSFLFVKMALTAAHPLDMLAHRFSVALIAATIPLLMGKIKIKGSFRELWPLLPLALFYPAMFFSFQTFGLVYASSSETGILYALLPIVSMLMAAIFLKERSTLTQGVFLTLSVAGVLFIFLMKGGSLSNTPLIGTVLILLSVLSSAGYTILVRKLVKRFSSLELTYVMTVIGFVTFHAIAISRNVSAGTLGDYFLPFTHLSFIISIAYLGILSSFLSSYLSNFALSRMEAAKMTTFNQLSTVVAILAGVVFLQEKLEWFHAVGTVMIIAGVIGTNTQRARKVPAAGPERKGVPLDS